MAQINAPETNSQVLTLPRFRVPRHAGLYRCVLQKNPITVRVGIAWGTGTVPTNSDFRGAPEAAGRGQGALKRMRRRDKLRRKLVKIWRGERANGRISPETARRR